MKVPRGLLVLLLLGGSPCLPIDAAPQRLPSPLPPPPAPPPVPPSGKPAPEATSTLVVPIKPDVELVPKVDPDPQRGLAIRGLLRWRLPEKP